MKKNLLIASLFLLSLGACQNKSCKTADAADSSTATSTVKAVLPGNYVSEGFASRDKGADWSFFSIKLNADSTYTIDGRSSHKPGKPGKPGLLYSAIATANGNVMVSKFFNDSICFTVVGDTLSVSATSAKALNFIFHDSTAAVVKFVRTAEAMPAAGPKPADGPGGPDGQEGPHGPEGHGPHPGSHAPQP